MTKYPRTVSFLDLLEQLQDDDEAPLDDSGVESKSLQAIRVGNNLRGKGGGSFWEDFIRVIGNADGVAELLGVSPDQVTRWGPRVRNAMQKVERNDKQQDTKQNALATGGGEEPATNPGDQPRGEGVPAQF